MNDETHSEALSALMDGELPDAEAERLLDAMRDDPKLREQWRRHHQISGLLTGHSELAGDGSLLADRVRDALDREPVPLRSRSAGSGSGRTRWPAGRWLALAASVVLAAVVVALGLTGERGPTRGPETVAQALPEAGAGPGPVTVAAGPSARLPVESTRLTWNDARPGVEARLNGYLLNHNEYLSDGVRGMLPYARVVGYDPRN